jgi:capsular exopolysaccharide synthesis family protein
LDAGDNRRSSGVVRFVLAHVRLILASMVLSAGAGAAIAYTQPDRYVAIATIELRANDDAEVPAATIDSEIEVIRSRTIALHVIEQLGLRKDSELAAAGWWPSFMKRADLEAAAKPAGLRGSDLPDDGAEEEAREVADSWFNLGRLLTFEHDAVVRAFSARLGVARKGSLPAIAISYSAVQPDQALRIVTGVAETYVRSQMAAKMRAGEVAGELIDERIARLRDKLAQSSREIQRIKNETNAFSADGRLPIERQLAQNSDALAAAHARTEEARARHEAARRMIVEGEGSDVIADVIKSNAVRLLRDELGKALRREAELATRYGARHPEMEKVAADIAKAQSELAAEIGRITHDLKTEYTVATDREAQIAARVNALSTRLGTFKEQQEKLRDLEIETGVAQRQLDALLRRPKQTDSMISRQLPDARIVAGADTPVVRRPPMRTVIVLEAIGIGSGIALLLAALMEWNGIGASRPMQVRRGANLAPLAALPIVPHDAHGLDRLRVLRQMLVDPHGAYAEGIRALQRAIDQMREGTGGAVLLVTSSVAGEGKSVTAANLALQCATSGQRTLLVDADVRSQGLTRALSLERHPGLLDVLGEAVPADRALLRDGTTGLFMLPASAISQAGAHVLGQMGDGSMRGLLGVLRGQFDTIVVDAPALLPVPDAHHLAREADHIVLVARARRTPREDLLRAVGTLGAGAQKIVGIVLNGAEGARSVQPRRMPPGAGWTMRATPPASRAA